MLELSDRYRIFIGFKMDGAIKRQLRSVDGPDKRYVSNEDPTFLLICRIGEDEYVGKVVEDRLTTDRVDDVRRNVLSILQRLLPETRLPSVLEIVPCPPIDGAGAQQATVPPPAQGPDPFSI